MRRSCLLFILVGLTVALPSCAAVAVGTKTQQLSDCDPLDPSYCALPFPNNFWRRANASHAGGFNVQLTKRFFPKSTFGQHIDPVKGGWNRADGFSPVSAISTFVGVVDLEAAHVARYWSIQLSTSDASPTLLVDVTTGLRVAHWAELDMSAGEKMTNATKHLFMIWPAARLIDGHTYAVALRNLTVAATGSLVKASPAFAALRDGTITNNYDIESRRGEYKRLFKTLQHAYAGVDIDSLQLAWQFTVASQHDTAGRLLHMRDDAFARVSGGAAIEWKVDSVVTNPPPSSGPSPLLKKESPDTPSPHNAHIARVIYGSMKVPQYVTNQKPGARLVLNAAGMPVYQTMAWIKFTVVIPVSVAQRARDGNGRGGKRVRVVQYGHGLFGQQSEVLQSYLSAQADQRRYVWCATTWIGLADQDKAAVALMLSTDVTDVVRDARILAFDPVRFSVHRSFPLRFNHLISTLTGHGLRPSLSGAAARRLYDASVPTDGLAFVPRLAGF
jgi:hypothetical protein